MTTTTAAEMLLDCDVMLVKHDDGKRSVHIYEADDGTALTIELTDLEAYVMDCYWAGEEIANENYNRVDD